MAPGAEFERARPDEAGGLQSEVRDGLLPPDDLEAARGGRRDPWQGWARAEGRPKLQGQPALAASRGNPMSNP